MLIALSLGVAFLGFSPQAAKPGTITYRNPELNLIFDYPAEWSKKAIQHTKTGRRKGAPRTTFVFNTPHGQAELEVYSVQYFGEISVWQAVQTDINRQLGRTVARQWQEEILGVPLLLTRVDYETPNAKRSVMTGLLYSMASRKLVFRLECQPDAAEEAEATFREVLQTLRTQSGDLPKPEDPNRQLTADDLNPKKRPQLTYVLRMDEENRQPQRILASGSLDMELNGSKAQLRFPNGWKAVLDKDGNATLTSAAFPAPVRVELRSKADTEDPARAFTKAVSASLELFEKVERRDEVVARNNAAGMVVNSVVRMGMAGGAPLCVCEALGMGSMNGWLARVRANAAISKGQLKVLAELFNAMSVETPAS